MRKYLYIILFIFVFFWLEVGFKKVFPESYLVPQFLLLLVAIFAIHRDLKQSLTVGLIAGFLGEIYSGVYFGTVMSSMLMCTIIVWFGSRNVTARALSLSNPVALTIFITALMPLSGYLYNIGISAFGLGTQLDFQKIFPQAFIWQPLVNLVFVLPMNRLFKFLFHE